MNLQEKKRQEEIMMEEERLRYNALFYHIQGHSSICTSWVYTSMDSKI
jgi:hypothetical protein